MNKTVIGAPNRAPLFHIAERALNRPLLVHPDKAAIVMDVLAGRIGVDAPDVSALSPEANRFTGSNKRDDGSYRVTRAAGGVAIITVAGSLVNRGAWIGAYSGLVSYEGVAAQVADAASDPSVHAVVLDIDSGGGEVGGVMALANQIKALDAVKPVVAVVNDTACSAAYWIASAAREIVVSPTSMVGSIGVVMLHVDRSGEMQQHGWSPTFIHAGAHKVDGNSLGPLPASVRADLQAMVDGLYSSFTESVAANRGKRLSVEQARATEARVFHGQAAIDAGLADRIGALDGVLTDLQSRRADPAARQPRKGLRMSADTMTQPGADAGISQAQMDAAVAAARAEGEKAGATAERARIAAILDSDAGKERPAMARKLAMTTDMTAEAAAAFMADLPAEKPTTQTPSLAERHAAAGGGAGAEGPGGLEAAADQARAGAGLMKKAAEKFADRRAGR